MEKLVAIGQAFVSAMMDGRGLSNVQEMYAETAESIEAVVPPDRSVRIAKGREAIKAKREAWLKSHELRSLEADGPYVHPPNRFGVRFSAEVLEKATGETKTLREIAIYSVENERIVREEFFMLPK
jgi:hypothetical protein